MYDPIIRNAPITFEDRSFPTLVDITDVYVVDEKTDSHGIRHLLCWDLNCDRLFVAVNCVFDCKGNDIFNIDKDTRSKIGFSGFEAIVCMDVVEFDSKVEAMRRWVEVCDRY